MIKKIQHDAGRPVDSVVSAVRTLARAAVLAALGAACAAHAVGVGGTGLQVVGTVDALDTLSVNSVAFTTEQASIIVNGTAASPTALGLGMTATVDGSWSTAGTLPAASRVAVQRAVRAPATYVGVGGTGWAAAPKTRLKAGVGGTGWAVAGLNLMLGTTVQWVGAASLADVAPGATLDVYGQPDYAQSIIVASRIEVTPPDTTRPVDVTGGVGAATPTGFMLGSASVDVTNATYEGLAAPLVPGTLVRVFGTQDDGVPAVIRASLIAAVVTPTAADGTLVRIEGLIQDFMGASQFTLAGQRVDAAAAFVTGGRLSDLREGLHVDVNGIVMNGIVLATLVEIEDAGTALPEAEVEGKITAITSPTSITIGSTQVALDSSTRIKGATLSSLRVGWKAHAHGVRSGTTIVAYDLEVEQ